MKFRFQKANCTAVGAFNVYIVQPQWLVGKGLLPKELEVIIESKMDEPGFRFHSSQIKVRWMVTPTRIVIETENREEDCGRVMADLLRWLPETPLVAIGNNTYYTADLGPTGEFLPAYPVVEPLSGFTLQQRSFHIGLSGGSFVHNLQLSLTEKATELLTNSHCPTNGEDRSARAQEHARRFMEQRRVGIDLARHHLKVDFDV